MPVKQMLFAGFLFLLFAGVCSASTVSIDSFKKSCNTCTFDAQGKMDKKCWEDIQESAKTSLGLAYPAMSFQYTLGGGCEALDKCISALQSCKAMYTTGNDKTDCTQGDLITCFKQADACADAANKVCTEGKSEEEAGLKDVIKNMTTKMNVTTTENETKEEPPTEEVEVDPWDFFWDCVAPKFIIAFGLLGTLFYSRR